MAIIKKLCTAAIYAFSLIGFVLVGGYTAIKLGFTKTPGIIDEQAASFRKAAYETPSWAQGEEWETLREAVRRDREAIERAAAAAGIAPRLLVSQLVVEQLRLYYSNRELFKKIFYPLKILGNQSQFSWGILGIKKETAIAIEEHLKDSSSKFYIGPQYERLLDFATPDRDAERFQRITDEKNHYYIYLYAALYLKQIMSQWQRAGFDISGKPEIVSTLYNIGFDHSKPHEAPHVGGAEIIIGGRTYSFGGLAREFYDSTELVDIFP